MAFKFVDQRSSKATYIMLQDRVINITQRGLSSSLVQKCFSTKNALNQEYILVFTSCSSKSKHNSCCGLQKIIMGKNSPREKVNNFNPYNKLKLNQFHQQQDSTSTQNKQLRKKQRDLERLLNYDKIAPEVKAQKQQELKEVREVMQQRRKQYEKQKRKEFFIEKKYGPIKQVEETKILRALKKTNKSLQQSPDSTQLQQERQDLQKKLRYVRNFPKSQKYLSLFPNNQLAKEVKQLQEQIMNQIERNYTRKQREMNKLRKDHGTTIEDRRIGKDNFFIVQEQEKGDQQKEQDVQEGIQEESVE